MSFPRYPKYKDSGVEWLGEVPEHWEVKKIKHLSSRISTVRLMLFESVGSLCRRCGLCHF